MDISTGDYSLTKVRTWAQGAAFAAMLVKDGRTLGEVSNDGRGGCNRYALPFADRDEFFAFARTATTAEFEPEDVVIERLLAIHDLGRKRSHVVLTGDMDVFEDGRYLSFPSAVPLAKVAQILTAEGRTNVRAWDKGARAFVTLAA